MTQLLQYTLDDFQGGVNLRANQFHLEPNESPDMLNVNVDPRGGFYSRRGWARWFRAPDFGAATWEPRSAEAHVHLDDTQSVFVTNDGKIWHSHSGDVGVFTTLKDTNNADPTTEVPCGATPHLADFASWGDEVYIACGRAFDTFRHNRNDTNTRLTPPAGTDPGEGINQGWNNDYTNPIGGKAPKAEFCEPHAGYMFYANLREDTGGGEEDHPTRIRWSHPGGQPEDFAFSDYIDIDSGGGQITGLLSFQDHLLIFKRDSLWALYGYDNISWQLIKVSRHIGAPSSTAITRSENAAYFFSTSGRNAIYGYTDGDPVEIDASIRTAVEQINHPNNVWLGWSGNLLICNLPWLSDTLTSFIPEEVGETVAFAADLGSQGAPSATDTTTFVFDLTVGSGSWTMHKMARGSLGPMVEGTDVIDTRPLSVLYNSTDGHQTMMELAAVNEAADILDTQETREPFLGYYSTHWLTADYPDRLKSWRRPRHVVRRASQVNQIRIDGFYDYEETSRRTHLLQIDTNGRPHWRGVMDSPPWDGITPPDRPAEVPSADAGSAHPAGDGFDWDGETLWSQEQQGAVLVRTVEAQPRGGGFGKARALKLRYVCGTGVPWGIDAIIMKYINRRFTT